MKKICCQEISLIILACLLFSPLSCNAYYFSRPQPVDRKNIYRFPKSFRGTWISGVPAMDTGKSIIVTFVYDSAGQSVTKDEKKSSFKEEESLDLDAGHYLVGHNYFLKVNCSKVRIQKGAWPKINQQGEFEYPTNPYGFKTISYDSLKKPIDTTDHYLVRGGFIYEINDESHMEKGYTCDTTGKEIVVLKNDTICYDLGRNTFLRKLCKRCYALNILNIENRWWTVMVLRMKRDGSVEQWGCSSRSGELSSMFYARPSKFDQFHFDSNWSHKEMLWLMKEGYFEISRILYKQGR